MKRRTALKLAIATLGASTLNAYDKTKIANTTKMKIADPKKPTKGELKHTPEISIGKVDKKGYVTVLVNTGQGGIIHPSTPDHWIYEIELYANGKKVAKVELEAEVSRGFLSAKVKKDGLKTLKAISRCNLHGDWQSTLEV